MKVILSFLLILLTAAHILPLNELVNGHKTILLADSFEENIEETKKEKFRQTGFYFLLPETIFNSNTYNLSGFIVDKSQFLHQVETPPPDII